MKVKTAVNTLIVASILLIFYFFVGHGFVKFYTGGKTELLETAAYINKLCNANGSCPTTLEGWQKSHSESTLTKGRMLYYVNPEEEIKGSGERKKNQTFKLVYRFFMPDNWFEARGGVGKEVTSGWTGR
jgi:hypothetical protein